MKTSACFSRPSWRAFAVFLACAISFGTSSARAVDALDLDAPTLGIIDPAGWLPLPLLKGLERVMEQHRALTQETVLVAIVPETPSGKLDDHADRLLQRWKGGTVRPTSVVVVLVDAGKEAIAIRTGVGLDPVLTSDRIGQIRDQMFKAELRAEHKDRAVVLSVVDALRALESPVVASGEARQILVDSGLRGDLTPSPAATAGSRWWIGFIPGVLLLLFACYRALEVEAHYSDTGWTRISPLHFSRWGAWRRRRRGGDRAAKLVTGGGVSGNW